MVDELVRVLKPTDIESYSTGEGSAQKLVYATVEVAKILRRVSNLLDADAYDVVIGKRHRELVDRRPLDLRRIMAPGLWSGIIFGLLYEYLIVSPAGPVADDAASLLVEILSREQDASFIEANGLKEMVYRIVLGHSDSPHHWYPRGGGRSHKVSDDCARRGLYKLRKNETLWALLLESPREFFVDSLKVLDPSLA
jgi:hypothetical protein